VTGHIKIAVENANLCGKIWDIRILLKYAKNAAISEICSISASHKHVGHWVVSNYIEFICLRGSSDSADPFISATAIQLTPSYTTNIRKSIAYSHETDMPNRGRLAAKRYASASFCRAT